MYLQHWGLNRSPFATTAIAAASPTGGWAGAATASTAYPSLALSEATARADYLVSQRRRLGVIVGGRGWGKTTALAAIADEQQRLGVQTARVDVVGLTSRDLLWRVAEGLGAAPDAADSQMRLWRRIEDHLAENRWQGRSTLLVVDDAEELGPDSQQQLVRLARLEADPAARWTLLLATTAETLDRLNAPLLHLIDLRIDLARWALDDTVGYVQSALVDAGRYEPIFDDAALDRLQELTRGVPRHVARLADFALLAGAGQRAPAIDTSIVEQAFAETRWSPGAAALAG